MSEERDPTRDQKAPVANNTEAIHDLVREDLAERLAFGTRKYGTPLQAHNGRDALLDAYEEALDLCVYLKQALVEKEVARKSGLRLTKEASKRLAEGLDLPPDLITPREEKVKADFCICGHPIDIHGHFNGCLADNGDWTKYCTCTLNQKDFS